MLNNAMLVVAAAQAWKSSRYVIPLVLRGPRRSCDLAQVRPDMIFLTDASSFHRYCQIIECKMSMDC
jgi:hypothetical protein